MGKWGPFLAVLHALTATAVPAHATDDVRPLTPEELRETVYSSYLWPMSDYGMCMGLNRDKGLEQLPDGSPKPLREEVCASKKPRNGPAYNPWDHVYLEERPEAENLRREQLDTRLEQSPLPLCDALKEVVGEDMRTLEIPQSCPLAARLHERLLSDQEDVERLCGEYRQSVESLAHELRFCRQPHAPSKVELSLLLGARHPDRTHRELSRQLHVRLSLNEDRRFFEFTRTAEAQRAECVRPMGRHFLARSRQAHLVLIVEHGVAHTTYDCRAGEPTRYLQEYWKN